MLDGTGFEYRLEYMTQAIQEAFKKATRKVSTANRSGTQGLAARRNDWWDGELRDIRSELKRAERRRDQPEKTRLRKLYRDTIVRKKSEALEKALDFMDSNLTGQDIFKAFRTKSPYEPLAPLEGCTDMEQSADLIADQYLGNLLDTPSVARAPQHTEHGRDDRDDTGVTFTAEDVTRVLHKRKDKWDKSPGKNGIRLRHLGLAPKWVLECIAELVSYSVNTCHVAAAWKASKVVLLKKSGRPANQVKSLRPVCLNCCIGKVAEALVAEHLAGQLERVSRSGTQFGFIKGGCTEDLVREVMKFQLASKKWITVSLDFSDAFGSIAHDKIHEVLIQRGTNRRIVNWISNWMHLRRMEMKVGNIQRQRVRDTGKGCPQGAILSPLIFATVVHKICEECSEELERVLPN
ncbi:conserved hypothetical protein, partial [Perkinsus marinus ATCC 50983]